MTEAEFKMLLYKNHVSPRAWSEAYITYRRILGEGQTTGDDFKMSRSIQLTRGAAWIEVYAKGQTFFNCPYLNIQIELPRAE